MGDARTEHPEQGSMGRLEGAVRRSPADLAKVLAMWVTGEKRAVGTNPSLPSLWVGDGSGPECRDQYSEIGAAISGATIPRSPRALAGGAVTYLSIFAPDFILVLKKRVAYLR